MNILFIIDSSILIDKINLSLLRKNDNIFLFPLSSKAAVIVNLIDKLKNIGCNITTLASAKKLHAGGEELRQRYIKFVAEIPARVSDKAPNLKEYFAVDSFATLWWTSLIAERNTFKSDFFNNLAKMQAITTVAKKENIKAIYFGGCNPKLQKALADFAARSSINYKLCPVYKKRSLGLGFRNLQQHYYLKHILLMLYYAGNLFLRTLRIKRNFGNSRRLSKNGSIIIITYYPNYDLDLAPKGIFKNNYYPNLQKSLDAQGEEIIWIAMMAKGDSSSLAESLAFTKGFKRGESDIFSRGI